MPFNICLVAVGEQPVCLNLALDPFRRLNLLVHGLVRAEKLQGAYVC